MVVRILAVLFFAHTIACDFSTSIPHFDRSRPDIICKVRPIIVLSNGQSYWDDQQIEDRIIAVNSIYYRSGIQFAFLDTEYLHADEFYELCDISIIEDISFIAQRHEILREELPIYFINSIEADGVRYGGLVVGRHGSHYGVLVAVQSSDHVVAHELGHAFGLRHTWEYDIHVGDIRSIDEYDCSRTSIKCNIMSYCGESVRPECWDHAMTDDQIMTVRYHAQRHPRLNSVFFPAAKQRH